MKFVISMFAFLFVLSVGVFAQEKSCCSSGDHVKKEVSIEKSVNKDGKNIEVKETVIKDGKTVEVKKVVKEEGCCSDGKHTTDVKSDKGSCSNKDVSMKKDDCCKSETKTETKSEK